MLELRAAHGRLAEPIDPSGQGIPYVPPELLARPPHHWTFEPI
jgi:hypothetical protein